MNSPTADGKTRDKNLNKVRKTAEYFRDQHDCLWKRTKSGWKAMHDLVIVSQEALDWEKSQAERNQSHDH